MNKENKYIKIVEVPHSGKTRGFEVWNKSGDYLIGEIEWYGAWRQYCFFPCKDFEEIFNEFRYLIAPVLN